MKNVLVVRVKARVKFTRQCVKYFQHYRVFLRTSNTCVLVWSLYCLAETRCPAEAVFTIRYARHRVLKVWHLIWRRDSHSPVLWHAHPCAPTRFYDCPFAGSSLPGHHPNTEKSVTLLAVMWWPVETIKRMRNRERPCICIYNGRIKLYGQNSAHLCALT